MFLAEAQKRTVLIDVHAGSITKFRANCNSATRAQIIAIKSCNLAIIVI